MLCVLLSSYTSDSSFIECWLSITQLVTGIMNSTSRGRGANRGGAKKPVLPNISAAGRREQLTNDAGEGYVLVLSTSQISHPFRTSRGRGDGRRGRRGGRGGRGRGSKQQGIIQSEGIFSMGLADHGVRQRGMKRDAGWATGMLVDRKAVILQEKSRSLADLTVTVPNS